MKLISVVKLQFLRPRKISVICLALVLMFAALPLPQLHAKRTSAVGSVLNKLSPALQGALESATDLLWLDSSRKTARVLIQTSGPVSLALITAVILQGGMVVRQFSSIDGLLVEIAFGSRDVSVAGIEPC